MGEHEKKKNYICLFPPKTDAAAPHQSVSRTNKHVSNLAWVFAKAVCSCDEKERMH